MLNRKSLLLAVIALVAAGSLFAAGNLNINYGNEPPELDPQITTDTVSIQIINGVFEGLVRYDNKGGIMPGMATKWDVSKDGKTYTFTMRSGAKWSNGDPVTAADFEYGIKRALDPKTASQYAYILYDILNAQEANEGKVGLDKVGVKAQGDKVVITLKGPVPYFATILTFPTAMPCNQKFIESLGADGGYGSEADKIVSNGPWTVSEWVHESKLVMKKNPNYWNAKAISLDSITGYMIADSNTSKTMFFNKELDIQGVAGVHKQDFVDRKYPIDTYADGACFYLEFNTTDPVVKNIKIRQALSAAVDRKSFVTNVLKDASLPATGYVVPILPGLKKSFREENGILVKDNDPVLAKKLFDEGLKELGLTTVKLSMLSDDGDRPKAMAAALQEMWRKNLGVEVTIEPMPFKARLQKMTDKDFQMVFAGWGPDYNDPMTFIDVFQTGNGNNHTYYSSAAYDDLIVKAKNEANPAKRMGYLLEAEKILMKDMPIAPIYFRFRWWTAQPNISGVVRRAVGGDPDLYWTVKK